MVQKLFGGIKMTWPRVLVFAVLAGAVTALAAMLVPDGNSFHEIAVSFEAWVLFAIFIITNCERPLEAALKTFVFFLVSQPLVYLIQVPFSWMGWGLFGYYRYWFFITLLTLPGAFLGWYIKKDNLWSGVILSVMLVLLLWLGLGYARDAAEHFPNHLISALFCFGQIPLYVFGILKNRKAKIAALAITALSLGVYAALRLSMPKLDVFVVRDVDEARYPVSSAWTVRSENDKIASAELFEMDAGDYYLRVHLYDTAESTVTLVDGEGREYPLTVSYAEDGGAVIRDAAGVWD